MNPRNTGRMLCGGVIASECVRSGKGAAESSAVVNDSDEQLDEREDEAVGGGDAAAAGAEAAGQAAHPSDEL